VSVRGQRARCLIIDDEIHNLDFLRRALEPEFEVKPASSGTDALKLLETERFALVISDHRMPGISGVEFLEQAAEIDPDMVRLMLTAYDDMPEVISARRRGIATAVLIKPTSAMVVTEAVRRWLAFSEGEPKGFDDDRSQQSSDDEVSPAPRGRRG
jgi:two-component system, NtrC family, response regulator AtoC